MNTKEKLLAHAVHNYVGIEHPSGWDKLVDDLHEALIVTDPDYKLVQTKEKIGQLCFYVEFPISEQGKKVIREAEMKSKTVCQACGQPGTLVMYGWWATLCPKHDNLDTDRGYRPHTPRNWQQSNVQGGTP